MAIKVVHAADFHLDSAFGAMPSEQAKLRRREMRALVEELSDYVNESGADLVFLAGDLFDSETTYQETVEQLIAALGRMSARIFIAPGNHDFYHKKSPYATLTWPQNVHIFKKNSVERVTIEDLGCAVYGAAFVSAVQEKSLLEGFCAAEDGLLHLMVLHGDVGAETSYNPITRDQIAQSNLDYLALGHVHEHRGLFQAGNTRYAYPGCLEGRGFDELGEKGFLSGTIEKGEMTLAFHPFAKRRYEVVRVDVSGKDPALALRAALPSRTENDLYRIIFTGETDASGVDSKRIYEQFAGDFFHLELRDQTRIGEDIWKRAKEDSLRGLFLRELQSRYHVASEEEKLCIERAVRFGLAALDKRDV